MALGTLGESNSGSLRLSHGHPDDWMKAGVVAGWNPPFIHIFQYISMHVHIIVWDSQRSMLRDVCVFVIIHHKESKIHFDGTDITKTWTCFHQWQGKQGTPAKQKTIGVWSEGSDCRILRDPMKIVRFIRFHLPFPIFSSSLQPFSLHLPNFSRDSPDAPRCEMIGPCTKPKLCFGAWRWLPMCRLAEI